MNIRVNYALFCAICCFTGSQVLGGEVPVFFGINISGADSGENISDAIGRSDLANAYGGSVYSFDGKTISNYDGRGYPTAAGTNLVRLPFKQEWMLDCTSNGEACTTISDYFRASKKVPDDAVFTIREDGIFDSYFEEVSTILNTYSDTRVILDAHNYGAWNYNTYSPQDGGINLSSKSLGKMWNVILDEAKTKLISDGVSTDDFNSKIWLELMNEPLIWQINYSSKENAADLYGTANGGESLVDIYKQAVADIRANYSNKILLDGGWWSKFSEFSSWQANRAGIEISDDNIAWSVHQYFDSDTSGTQPDSCGASEVGFGDASFFKDVFESISGTGFDVLLTEFGFSSRSTQNCIDNKLYENFLQMFETYYPVGETAEELSTSSSNNGKGGSFLGWTIWSQPLYDEYSNATCLNCSANVSMPDQMKFYNMFYSSNFIYSGTLENQVGKPTYLSSNIYGANTSSSLVYVVNRISQALPAMIYENISRNESYISKVVNNSDKDGFYAVAFRTNSDSSGNLDALNLDSYVTRGFDMGLGFNKNYKKLNLGVMLSKNNFDGHMKAQSSNFSYENDATLMGNVGFSLYNFRISVVGSAGKGGYTFDRRYFVDTALDAFNAVYNTDKDKLYDTIVDLYTSEADGLSRTNVDAWTYGMGARMSIPSFKIKHVQVDSDLKYNYSQVLLPSYFDGMNGQQLGNVSLDNFYYSPSSTIELGSYGINMKLSSDSSYFKYLSHYFSVGYSHQYTNNYDMIFSMPGALYTYTPCYPKDLVQSSAGLKYNKGNYHIFAGTDFEYGGGIRTWRPNMSVNYIW